MESPLIRDEGLYLTGTPHMLQQETALVNQFYSLHGGLHLHQHSAVPHTVFPFSLPDVGDVDTMLMAGNAASAGGHVVQVPVETRKRPVFWPFGGRETVKSLSSADCNGVNEQHSGSTTEFCNMSNTAMIGRMVSHEEVEISNLNEVESRIRKKKRLTDAQVHALESSFEANKKLDADRKQKLADRLGLESRQVAVWFQNRRARSKTKHLEHDFALLQSKYHSILAETHKLRSEVSRLTAELEAVSRGDQVLGATSGAWTCETQLPALQNSGPSQHMMSTSSFKSMNNVMTAKEQKNPQMRGSRVSLALMNCPQENFSSQSKSVEADHTTSAACLNEAGNHHNYVIEQAPCLNQNLNLNHELNDVACCLLDSQANGLRNVDNYQSNCCSSSAAYPKKANAALIKSAHHKLQQAMISDDSCLQRPVSLWELTA